LLLLLLIGGAVLALRQSAVLLERSQLIDAERFSALEELSSIVPEHLKNQPFIPDVDDGLGVILDSWQSVDGPLHLIGRHLSPSCCERCVVLVDNDVVLFSTMNVRRSSDLSIECLFRNQYSIESFLDDAALRTRRVTVTVEMRGLNGGAVLLLPSLAVVNASDVVADVNVHLSRPLAQLCACTVVMNRNAYIPEWIAFHRSLGVEQFFFYRNGGERLDEALLSLLDDGVPIDSYFWAHARSQRQAFAHCMARLRDRCEWALFVDVDEFVVPASPRASLSAIVRATRSDIIELPASVFAAASGSHALVIESSTRYFAPATQVNAKKSLVRTSAAKLANNIHTFELDRAHRKPGSICAPPCALALASLSHFRFIGWSLYMRRTLDGVAGDVGLWRVPRVLSVLKPSMSFVREATLESGRFEAVDERLLVRAPALRAELRRLGQLSASERTRAIRQLLARHPPAAVSASDIERATLSRDELAAVAADADALLAIVAQGTRHLSRTAPDGTALAVLLVPP
jgi:hypothetical protein